MICEMAVLDKEPFIFQAYSLNIHPWDHCQVAGYLFPQVAASSMLQVECDSDDSARLNCMENEIMIKPAMKRIVHQEKEF